MKRDSWFTVRIQPWLAARFRSRCRAVGTDSSRLLRELMAAAVERDEATLSAIAELLARGKQDDA